METSSLYIKAPPPYNVWQSQKKNPKNLNLFSKAGLDKNDCYAFFVNRCNNIF